MAPKARTRKPKPTKKRPEANLAGLDGSRLPSLIHSQAKTGASVQMKNELTDCSQLDGNLKPKMELRVKRSAKRLSVEPACSKADQKREAKTKKRKMAAMRLRSAAVKPGVRKRQTRARRGV